MSEVEWSEAHCSSKQLCQSCCICNHGSSSMKLFDWALMLCMSVSSSTVDDHNLYLHSCWMQVRFFLFPLFHWCTAWSENLLHLPNWWQLNFGLAFINISWSATVQLGAHLHRLKMSTPLCCYVPAFGLKAEDIDAMQKIELCNGDLCDDLDCT